MSVYHCRKMHYLLTATTRCISFGRQLLYMKGYDGRPLGHVVFRQLFLFSPPSISHPFYANIRANIRRYKRGVNAGCQQLLDNRVSVICNRFIYIMYQNKSNLLTYKLQKRFVDRACDWTLWPVGECTITLLGKPMTMELKNVVITQRIDLTVRNVTQILYNHNSNTKCTLLWFFYT